MQNIILAVLYVFCMYAAAEGFMTLNTAASAFHQIYGAIWMAITAICISAIGIMHAIISRNASSPAVNDVPKDNLSGTPIENGK